MPRAQPACSRPEKNFAFFREFLKHPLQIASLIPSSGFLERRLIDSAELGLARTVVELGPGTGGTTRAILGAMPQHGRLLSIEINPHFYRLVAGINDDRLIAHLGSAAELREIMSLYGLDAPDVVISGIPFSTMKSSTGAQVLEAIASVLAPNGRLVAYQVSARIRALCQPFLGPGRMELEPLNIPPLRIFSWRKNGA